MAMQDNSLMDETAFGQLIYKIWSGQADAQETALFESLLRRNPEYKVVYEKQTSWEVIQERLNDIYEFDDQAIRSRMRSFQPKWKRIVYPLQAPGSRKWLLSAAAVVAALLLGLNAIYFHKSDRKPENQVIAGDVFPGRNQAILTLAGGQKIMLDSSSVGKIGHQGNADIVKSGAGSIAYHPSMNSPLEATLNNLETPPAGQFQITLPDGTLVWLNNASRLTYPTAFVGKERQVELSGEAFFQVAKDAARPFRVKVRDETVQVLGTSFNINAYLDEPAIATTLVDGAVAVDHKGESVKLQPGNQARISQQGDLKVLPVSVEPIIAWKNGFFTFDESVDFAAAMRQLSRWYAVRVEYEGEVPHQVFYGTIDRQVTLSQILKIFESKEYKLEIEGRTLHVRSRSSEKEK